MSDPTRAETLFRGVWRENPVMVHMLGLCPALAVTNTVENSLAMGIATLFVLVGSSVLVSTFKRFIPHEVRISTYILIIATFVTVVDMSLAAWTPALHKALGAYIALIVVNCMILGRQEAFAAKQSIGRSFIDALGTGLGFILALVMLGSIREILGSGSFLGVSLFGDNFEPWLVMVLPPGGFLALGFWLLGLNWWVQRREARATAGGAA